MISSSANFTFLETSSAQLARLGALAEWSLHFDPPTSILKIRQFKEELARLVAAQQGALSAPGEVFAELLTRLQREVGALIQNIQSGKNLRCDERPPLAREKGVVKVSAVTWGKLDPLQSKTLPPDYRPLERERIRTGGLLFSRANTLELVGACVIVGEAPDNLYLSDKVLRLDVGVSERAWLLWFLRSPEGRRQLEEVSSGN